MRSGSHKSKPQATPAVAPLPQTPARRKGAAVREWLVVSVSGRSWVEEAGRHSVMRRTGLPARDLRMFDPLLSYPCTILGRERAIMVNLEHVKAIITAVEALVPNSRDPLATAFVNELQTRLSRAHSPPPQAMEKSEMDGQTVGIYIPPAFIPGSSGSPKSPTGTPQHHPSPSDDPTSGDDVQESSPRVAMDQVKDGSIKVLPFEFRVLEICLESACKFLESETCSLEKEAHPTLDELTSKISTLNLERVRQIKSRLVAISGRVHKMRDELERLLDDDMDIAAMFLTEKLVHQVGKSSRFDLDEDAIDEGGDRDDKPVDETESSNGSSGGFNPNINELENLLEAYFVQIDGTLTKLSTLRECVDDTEDYINIMLDDKQNQLLQMGVMLSTATLIITMAVIVVGVLGMNIHINIFDAPYSKFWGTTSGLVASMIVVYILAILWDKKSGLLR